MGTIDLGDSPTVIVDWMIDVIPKGPVAVITWGCLDPKSRRPIQLDPPHVWTVVMLQRFQEMLPELIQTLQDAGGRGMQ